MGNLRLNSPEWGWTSIDCEFQRNVTLGTNMLTWAWLERSGVYNTMALCGRVPWLLIRAMTEYLVEHNHSMAYVSMRLYESLLRTRRGRMYPSLYYTWFVCVSRLCTTLKKKTKIINSNIVQSFRWLGYGHLSAFILFHGGSMGCSPLYTIYHNDGFISGDL